jgi:hypothetical protein
MATRMLGTVTNEMAGVSPPAGQYRVMLKEIDDIESSFDENGNWKWVFTIEDVINSDDDEAESFIGQELYGFSSKGLGPRHKARAWIEALMGQKLDEGEPVREDDLIGKRAVANVIDYKRTDGSDGTKIASEGGLSRFKGKKKAKPAPPPEDDDSDDDEMPF